MPHAAGGQTAGRQPSRPGHLPAVLWPLQERLRLHQAARLLYQVGDGLMVRQCRYWVQARDVQQQHLGDCHASLWVGCGRAVVAGMVS